MARTSEGGLFSDERNLGVDKPGYERVDLSFPRERVHELDQNPLCRDFLITCAGFYDQALTPGRPAGCQPVSGLCVAFLRGRKGLSGGERLSD